MDGSRLLVVLSDRLLLLDGEGRELARRPPRDRRRCPCRPTARSVAVVRRTEVVLLDHRLRGSRRLFAGGGRLAGLAWSPDGRWLLVGWPAVDQWVFIRAAGASRIVAVSNVSEQFRSGTFPPRGGLVLRGLILAAVALAAASGGSAATPQRTLAYVALEEGGQPVQWRGTSGRGTVLARIPVPAGPHNLTASGDGRIVVVTSPPAGRITIIDGRRFRVLRVVGGFRSPHDVKLSPDGRTAYVNEGRGTLTSSTLPTDACLRRLPAGAGAHDLAGGDLTWVTHGPRRTPLTLFSLAGPRLAASGTLDAGGAAHDAVFAPDTADVFVTYWESGTVARFRTGRKAPLWRRSVGSVTHHLAFDYYSGQRLWVSDRAGRVLLLDARNGAVLQRFGGCAGPHHVAVTTARRAVAACNAAGTVAVFDDRAGLVRTVAVGRGPHGVAIAFVP